MTGFVSECDLCGESATPPVAIDVAVTRRTEIGSICVECVGDLYEFLHGEEYDDGDEVAEYITRGSRSEGRRS